MDYLAIYDKMEFGKSYKAADLGAAPASMTAMVRRGLVEKINTRPLTYKKRKNNTTSIISIVKANGNPEYFVLYRKNAEMGMLCSCKENDILDCWGVVYDTSDVVKVKLFNPNRFVEL